MIRLFSILIWSFYFKVDERIFQIYGGVDYMYYYVEVEVGNPK